MRRKPRVAFGVMVEDLAAYQRLGWENRPRQWDVLALSVLCPVAASLIAIRASRVLPFNQTLVTVVILALAGYLPAIQLSSNRVLGEEFERLGWIHPSDESLRKQNRVVLALMHLMLQFVGNSLLFAAIALAAAVPAILIQLAASLILRIGDDRLTWFVGLPCFVLGILYGTAFMFSKTRPPFRPLRQHFQYVLVDVRLGAEDILGFLAGAAATLAISGSGPLGLLYWHTWEAVTANGLSGLLLGLSLWRAEQDRLRGHILRLGEARCLLRLGKRHEARYRIEEVKAPGRGFPSDLAELAELLEMIEQQGSLPPEGVETLQRLWEDARDDRLGDLWTIGVRETFDLAGLPVPRR